MGQGEERDKKCDDKICHVCESFCMLLMWKKPAFLVWKTLNEKSEE
jgi:hypothetical protein